MVKFFAMILRPFLILLDWLQPVADLLARCWIAWIFFKAGLVKIGAWQSTLLIFANEYNVPLLSSEAAAVLGTAAELILPVLLVLGLGGRITILLFFIYNLIAVISYNYLWMPEGWAGLAQHINWGLLLALLMTHGSGKISLDYLIRKFYGHHLEKRGPDGFLK